MKKIYALMLLLTGIVNAQIVTIPDANFKAKLIANGIDSNSDGNIQVSEALAVTTLDIQDSNISDLTGLNAFANITNLYVGQNLITSLIVSLPQLTYVDFSPINQPLIVDLSGCPELVEISCSYSHVTSLNISGLTHFTTLNYYVGSGDLTLKTINASGCTALTSFNQPSSNLTFVNLSGCTSLTSIDVTYNYITDLNITGCSALTSVNAFYNLLTTFDISDFPNIDALNVASNHLSTLFIKNGRNESSLSYLGNVDLQFICADDSQVAQIQNSLLQSLTFGVTVSSYCTFVPGGDYNTITGSAHFDADNNGCDNTDIIPENVRFSISDGLQSGSTFTNSNGNYYFYPLAGSFTLTANIENPSYFNISPATATLNFPLTDNSVQQQDFCVTANGAHPDLEVIIVPLTAIPGFDSRYLIYYKNKGNQLVSGSINFTFDDARTDFISATPTIDVQSGDTLTWNFSNLQPFESRTNTVVLNINSPVENPPVHAGDILDFNASVSAPIGDATPGDNMFELHQTVVNALDPNDKTCLEGVTVTVDNAGKYLHYNINFENTGTAEAVNVVVKDVINTAQFDINSLQVLYASNPVQTRITGNVVEFIFENINLPPATINPIGGHGNVLFKIKTLPGQAVGTQVTNTAGIYFDYNAPIVTNTARTTFAALSKTDFKKDNSVNVYPNPAKSPVNIKAGSRIKIIALYDIEGRILATFIENKNTATLDISGYENGIYFLEVLTEDGGTTEKIIKE